MGDDSVRKKHVIYIVLFVLMILPFQVKGYYCPTETKQRLRKIASNVTFSYTANEKNGKMTFSVTISNLNKEIVVKDIANNRVYKYNNKPEITLSGFQAGKSYTFRLEAVDQDCNEEPLHVYYANFPFYNAYYKDPVCEDMGHDKLCQKFIKHGLTYEQFVKEIKKHKEEQKQEEEQPIEKDEEKDLIEVILDFISKHYIPIAIGTILLTGIVIFLYKKKNDVGF